MKELLCVILALCILCMGTAVLAEDVALDEGEYVSSMAVYGGEALLRINKDENRSIRQLKDGVLTTVMEFENDVIFTYYEKLTDEEKAEIAKSIDTVLPGDDGVYAYSTYGFQLYKWDGAQFAPVGKPFDSAYFCRESEGHTYVNGLQGCVVGGKLLAIFSGDESTDYCPILYTFDLATGEARKLDIEGLDYVQDVAVYKDGQAMLCYQDPENDYRMTLRTVDVNAGTLSEEAFAVLDGYSASGLTYDPETDSVYYYDQGSIIRHKAGAQPEIVAYPPTNYIYAGAILDGKYCAAMENTITSIAVDGSALPERTLRVQGGYMDEIQQAYLKENPGVGIASVDEWYDSSEEIATAIKTGEKGIDIFSLSASNGLYSIINKGYALDLSDSAIISAAADSYYPGYAHALRDEKGHVFGVFDSVHAYGYPTINVERWEELDLGDYPTTYSELIDLIAMWNEDYAEDYPDMTMLMMLEKRDLINTIINAYILQYENAPGGLNFNNPALREVLEKIDALEMENIDWENMTDADFEEINELYQREEIFSFNGEGMGEGETYHVYSDSGDHKEYTLHVLAPLTFEEGVEPRVQAGGEIYIVNPESPNKDLAIEYLEYRVQHMSDHTRYLLDPSLTEPVRQENFEKTVENMQKALERMQAEMDKADDVDKADYQYSIDYYTSWLAEQDKNQWAISQQQIDRYREIAPYAYIPSESLFLTYDGENTARTELYDMISRYADGQLTLDAFLREMDQKIRMIVLEGR